MICKKCAGDLEPIIRGDKFVFNFCRACKLPHDEHGMAIIKSTELKSHFNPLSEAREIASAFLPSASPEARSAVEVLLVQGLYTAYFDGLKDGVLLAYSQDVGQGGWVTKE